MMNVVALLFCLGAEAAETKYTKVETVDGITIESRKVEG